MIFNTLLACLDGFVLFMHPSRARGKLLLIIRLDAIGDFVLWLSAAEALVRDYHAKGYYVVLLGNEAWACWAKEMHLADEIWAIDVSRFRHQFSYRWQWLRQIRRAGFRVAIQPTYSRVFIEGDALIKASGAQERIGSIGDEHNITSWHKAWSNRWYTRLIPATPMPLMELKRNAEFMRGIGIACFQARMPLIAQVVLDETNCLPPQPYAVLFPSASWEGKEWSIDNFIEIGNRLTDSGLCVVIAGGAGDRHRAGRLGKSLFAEAINLAGKTSLGQLAELLRGATVAITNDTSAMHIGAAVGVPVVCIVGGGHFGRFAPYELDVTEEDTRPSPIVVAKSMECYGCNWQCHYPRSKGESVKCIKDISVEKAWQEVERVLNKYDKCSGG